MLHRLMRRRALPILGAFLALAVVWTWPLARHLSSRIPHDPGDPILNIWLLWWNAQAIPFTEHWWNPPIFYPMPGALALSEHLAGIGLVTTPMQWFHANALSAYNVALILSFALSGFFTFFLVRRLVPASSPASTRAVAAICGALAYGFGPYRAGQLAHLQVLTSQWMPLALLAMHAHVEDGSRRWLLVFAAAWLLQALSNGYYLLFFPVLIVCWLAWFVDWRRAPSRGIALAATWICASLLLVPVLLTYARVQRGLGVGRTAGEMGLFSANSQSFLHAAGMLAFWPSSAALTTEDFLFPGVTSVVLVIAGCLAAAYRARRPPEISSTERSEWASSRSAMVFYVGAAVLMWALAFGPAPPESRLLALARPYTFLVHLPGFDALRVPARFAMLATLCFATSAGLAFVRIAPHRTRLRWVVAAVAIVGLLADGWMRPMPLAAPPGRLMLDGVPEALMLTLPANVGPVDVAAMYRQTVHGRPIANGYSGYTPPHYMILSLALRRGDPSVITELAKGRPLVIIVNSTFDARGQLRHLVEGLPGIEARGASSAGSMFVLPALPAARVAPVGDPWPASVRDGARDEIEIDLGQSRVVRTIGFPLRWRYDELHRRIAIDGSVDGVTWSSLWEDWTGGPALAAALADPQEVPVRLTIPDVPARYVRLRPASAWMRREVRVYGPK
jgi:hypothetical protein